MKFYPMNYKSDANFVKLKWGTAAESLCALNVPIPQQISRSL